MLKHKLANFWPRIKFLWYRSVRVLLRLRGYDDTAILERRVRKLHKKGLKHLHFQSAYPPGQFPEGTTVNDLAWEALLILDTIESGLKCRPKPGTEHYFD
jgi:hypothetical protein